ncbi:MULTISPECIES: hypothetical protein [Natronorubrum]|uniref:Uncharacterized protein n=2 Tax=Natronorubrum TaxID=134813 RepID=A0A1N7ANF5_9EURY|nr:MULTISPECIES: hypothetical protein [Natronorubrum]APX97927.1 hypothetical protein BB347_15640 [Natronorubrum daqingense]SEH13211.1 hypothetical protein SAMN04487967_1219 [Natronorubrum sediminis]SIR40543.1 hypothetical protein SAMN05421809_1233 [Natronorubrum daqingense]
MDKESLPRWGWLLIGLFGMVLVAELLNFYVFRPAGVPQSFEVIPIITAMAPVLIFIGPWYDEERQHYWEQSQAHIVGDLLFVLVGAALGSAIVLAAIVTIGLPRIVQDILAMGGGFMLSWGLFWWRNTALYAGTLE